MNRSTKINIIAALKAYLASNNLTQADFARKIDMRGEYMTHLLRENSDFTVPTGGKPTPIADKYFDKIAVFIGFSYKKEYWKVMPTPQFTAAIAILADAKKHGTTNIIIGETGSGKTVAIEAFMRKHPVDTFIVTVGSTDNLGDLIEKIVDKLKITTGKTKSKKLRDISNKLRQMSDDGHNPVIIFDESEYMKQPALASMKELYDYLFEYASIVLVGTEQLIENIDRLRKKNKPGIPQFYRRIKFGIRYLPNIDKSYKEFDLELDKEVMAYVRTLADNYGELHDVMVPVRRESERTGEPVTINFINKVLNLRHGGR